MDQSIRVRIRQRVEEYRLDDGEHRCVDADPQGQGDESHERKAAGVHQLPEPGLHVVSHLIEMSGADVVAGFLVAAHVAKAPARGARGVCLAHARANILTSNGVDVKRHLLIHLRVLRIPSEDGEDAAKQSR